MTEDISDQDEQCYQVVKSTVSVRVQIESTWNLSKLGNYKCWRVSAIWIIQASNCFSETPVSTTSYMRAQSRPKRSKTLLRKSNGREKVCNTFFICVVWRQRDKTGHHLFEIKQTLKTWILLFHCIFIFLGRNKKEGEKKDGLQKHPCPLKSRIPRTMPYFLQVLQMGDEGSPRSKRLRSGSYSPERLFPPFNSVISPSPPSFFF